MRNKKGYFWTLFGKFLPQGLYLATTMFLARFLSPEDFGTIGVLSVFVLTANTLMDAGFGGSLIKEPIVTKEDYDTIATFNLAVSFVLYVLMIILGPVIENFYSIEGLANVINVLSILFLINAIGLIPAIKLTKELRFKEITYATIISVIAASVIAIITAYFGWGVYALVCFQIVQNLIRTICLKLYSKYHFCFRFYISCFKKMISFGLYTTLVNVIDTVYENLMASIFGKVLGTAETGYLTQAKKIEEVTTVSVIQTINGTSFPILSKLNRDYSSFKKEAQSVFFTFCLLLFPIPIIISLYADQIVIIVFGDAWIKASAYLPLLCFAGIFIIMENLNRNFIKSLGMASTLFYVTILKRIIGIVIIVVAFIINIKYMLHGYIISSFVAFIINQIAYCKIVKESFFSTVRNILFVLFPPIMLFFILYSSKDLFNSLLIDIVRTGVITLLYYLVLFYMKPTCQNKGC